MGGGSRIPCRDASSKSAFVVSRTEEAAKSPVADSEVEVFSLSFTLTGSGGGGEDDVVAAGFRGFRGPGLSSTFVFRVRFAGIGSDTCLEVEVSGE